MKTIKVYDSTWRRDVVILIESIKYAGRAKDGGTVIFLRDNQEIFTDRDLDGVQAMINGEEPTVVSVVVEELQRQVNELKEQWSTAKIELKSWQHDSRHAWARVSELETECNQLRRQYKDEEKIVDEVWKALGFACYQECGGKTIWELVAGQKAALQKISQLNYREAATNCAARDAVEWANRALIATEDAVR